MAKGPHGCESPPRDPLRPDASQSPSWYRGSGPVSRAGHKRHYPDVGTVTKMILEAGSDPAVANKSNLTALDVALDANCADFVKIFAEDESLFVRGTEKSSQGRKGSRRRPGRRPCYP